MARRHSAAEGGQERAQRRHATQQSCFRLGICISPPSRHLDLLTHTCMAHMVIRTFLLSHYLSLAPICETAAVQILMKSFTNKAC